ncbi:MAG TPA: hypothetical protein VET89_04605 [Stellaceae bacterium]|nr:hypothetical protein [Stellaceae bacterium]
MSRPTALTMMLPCLGWTASGRQGRWLALWRQWRQRVRDAHAAALLSPRELDRLAADIGVSPAALKSELSWPLWRCRRKR